MLSRSGDGEKNIGSLKRKERYEKADKASGLGNLIGLLVIIKSHVRLMVLWFKGN